MRELLLEAARRIKELEATQFVMTRPKTVDVNDRNDRYDRSTCGND